MEPQYNIDDCVKLKRKLIIGSTLLSNLETGFAVIVLNSGTLGMVKLQYNMNYACDVQIGSVTYTILNEDLELYRKSFWPDTDQTVIADENLHHD